MIFKVNDKLISIKKTITQAHINQYAKASGDFNPIHDYEEFGKNSQFKGNIAHGMMIAATISELMTKAFNLAWYETGTMKIRFKAPVFPEDTITTSGVIQKISLTEEQKHYVQCKVEIFRQSGDIAIQATTSVEIKNY